MDEAMVQYYKLALLRRMEFPHLGKVQVRDVKVDRRGNFGVLLAQSQPAKVQNDLI
jgi:hypothetical protein